MQSLDNKRTGEPLNSEDESGSIIELLEQLRLASTEKEEALLWSEIHKKLLYEFHITPAFYGAVLRVVSLANHKALDHRLEYLHFVGVVEALRHRRDAQALSPALKDEYFAALKSAESMIIECLEFDWDESGYRALLGSLASVRAGLEFRDGNHGSIWD
jgi:hypothetical protein